MKLWMSALRLSRGA